MPATRLLLAPLGQGSIDAYGAATALVLLSGTLPLVPLPARSLTGRVTDQRLSKGLAAWSLCC